MFPYGFVAAAAIIGALAQAPGIPPRYLDEYECIFHRGLDDEHKVSLWCVEWTGTRTVVRT